MNETETQAEPVRYVTLTPNYDAIRAQFDDAARESLRRLLRDLDLLSDHRDHARDALDLSGELRNLLASVRIVAEAMTSEHDVTRLRGLLADLSEAAVEANNRMECRDDEDE